MIRPNLFSIITCTTTIYLAFFAGLVNASLLNTGDIIVTDRGGVSGNRSDGSIIKVDPLTGIQSIISHGHLLNDPAGIVIDKNGNFIVADISAFGGLGGLIRIDPSSGAQTALAWGGTFVDPTGIAINKDGNFVITDQVGVNDFVGRVILVDAITGEQKVISENGFFAQPVGVAIDTNNDIIVTNMWSKAGGPAQIIRVNPDTGAQTIIAEGLPLNDPVGVLIGKDGSILVVDQNLGVAGNTNSNSGGIISVDPSTGEMTTLFFDLALPQPLFMTADLLGNIVVVDDLREGILEINLATGNYRLISQHNYILNPTGVAIIPGTTSSNLPNKMPEPPIFTLFGFGLGYIGFVSWRRKVKHAAIFRPVYSPGLFNARTRRHRPGDYPSIRRCQRALH